MTLLNINWCWSARRIQYRCALLVGMFCCLVLSTAGAEQSTVSKRYAFAVNGLDFSLSTFSVGKNGGLRHLGHLPMTKSVPFVLIDPSGQFVLVSSKTVSTISVFRLNKNNGNLTPVPGSPFPADATSPFSMVFHPSGKFLYASARFSGVGAYAFDVETGRLTTLPGTPFLAGKRTRGISMHPSGKFLYASNGYSNSVSAYRIDESTGMLAELPKSPFSAGDMGVIDYEAYGMADVPAGAGGIPYDVAVDPQGRFAFVTNWAAASVSVFRIDSATGHLTAVKGSPFFTGFNPYRLAVHPKGDFLYVTQFSSSEIAVHAIDSASGKLTVVKGSPFPTGGLGPVAVNFNSNGTQLYVPNYESNDITLFDVDRSTGGLQLKEIVKTRSAPWYVAVGDAVDVASDNLPSLLLAKGDAGLVLQDMNLANSSVLASSKLDSDGLAVADLLGGRFVYVISRNKGELSTLRMDRETGQLSPVSGGVVATGKLPGKPVVDVNSWYLYVPNEGDNSISAFYLDPQTGIPRAASKQKTLPSGKRPVSVVLDEAARYAFVSNAGESTVSVFRYMNSVTPLIYESRGAGSPFPVGETSGAVAVDPTGRFAYVANTDNDAVSAYRIHFQTGALSALPGSPFKSAGKPYSVKVHPNGRWLYSVNEISRSIEQYEIESELGALNKLGVAARLPVNAKSMWMTKDGGSAFVLSVDGLRLIQYRIDSTDGRFSLASERRFTDPVTDLHIVE